MATFLRIISPIVTLFCALFVRKPSDKVHIFERIFLHLLKHRDIVKVEDGQTVLCLRRFYLTPRSWPIRIFLDKILRSDSDHYAHDHPGDFASLICKGCYVEEIGGGKDPDIRVAPPGKVLDNPAEHMHRVEIVEPVWTLVLSKRAHRNWGFWVPDEDAEEGQRFVHWRMYLGEPHAPTAEEDRIPQ